MIPHLLRCRGFAVDDYSFTLGRLGSGASQPEAGKPRLSLYKGHNIHLERRNEMKKNMGTVDRGIRISLAVIVAILYFNGKI